VPKIQGRPPSHDEAQLALNFAD